MNNEFWNAVQAASNSVAGNVAGPVDILGFLLRKAGVPVPENALLSSRWMEEQGLMKPVRQGVGQVVGDTFGLLAPTLIAANAGKIAAAAIKGGENLSAPVASGMAQGERGAIVYHGSPHKFDKFDSSKIGTGEGAQAYGHGLYLADSPGVAQAYKDKLSAGAGIGDDDTMARVLQAVGGDKDKAAAALTQRAKYANIPGGKEKLLELADKVRSGYDPTGALYKVDLPDEKIAKMLDWDKPLSEQAPEVQQFFRQYVDPIKKVEAGTSGPEWGELAKSRTYDPAGSELVRLLAPANNSLDASTVLSGGTGGAATSRRLMEAGIPGIRYLDGGSRSAGAGSSNYVIFPGNEGILKILERNGQGLLDPPVTPALLNQGKRGQRGAFVFPGEERLLTAQKNAAKPISEGGLGLRADNTAAERAKALGFDTEFQHGSPSGDISAFDIAKTQKSDAGYMGQGIYGTELGATAYADSNVYPLLTKSKGARLHDMSNWNAPDNPYSTIANRFGTKDLADKQKVAQEYRKEMLGKGHHAIIDRATSDGTLGQVVVYDPAQIRSRFAAFDPMRSSEADILGGADPYLLALLGLGTGGAAYFGSK